MYGCGTPPFSAPYMPAPPARILKKPQRHDSAVMQQMQAYIGVRAAKNSFELSDLPPAQTELYNSVYSSKVHGQIRVPKTKWVVRATRMLP